MVEIPGLQDEDPAVRKEAQIYSIVVNGNALERVVGYHVGRNNVNIACLGHHSSQGSRRTVY